MNITNEILKRATIQAITDYLLYGSSTKIKSTTEDSETKLNNAFQEFENILHPILNS